MGFAIFNPLNAELSPVYSFVALLGAHHIFHLSWLGLNAPQGWVVLFLTL